MINASNAIRSNAAIALFYACNKITDNFHRRGSNKNPSTKLRDGFDIAIYFRMFRAARLIVSVTFNSSSLSISVMLLSLSPTILCDKSVSTYNQTKFNNRKPIFISTNILKNRYKIVQYVKCT